MEPHPPRPKFRIGRRPPAASEAAGSILTNYTPPRRERYWLHAFLFALTVVTTAYAGALLAGRVLVYEADGTWAFVLDGLCYAIPLLSFLTVHEFGHYFAARYYRIDVSLPYFIPFPLPFLQPNIGTFGAVIRIREPLRRTRQLFDVGVAGPLAGFVVALGVLVYALATLPPPEYLLTQGGHENLKLYLFQHGTFPPEPLPDPTGLGSLTIGQTPLYWALSQLFPNVPPMYEMYHYPVLFAGWLGLFFTALNLLPVGQLDGGHILYALLGPTWHGRVARAFVLVLLFSGAIGFVLDFAPLLRDLAAWNSLPTALGEAGAWLLTAGVLYFFLGRLFRDRRVIVGSLFGLIVLTGLALRVEGVPEAIGYSGWFFWCLLIVTLIKVDHPPVLIREPLTPLRRALGIAALVIFVLCFSIKPIYIA